MRVLGRCCCARGHAHHCGGVNAATRTRLAAWRSQKCAPPNPSRARPLSDARLTESHVRRAQRRDWPR
eukprot:6173066-Pleurochrysis_carterae.AAC.3